MLLCPFRKDIHSRAVNAPISQRQVEPFHYFNCLLDIAMRTLTIQTRQSGSCPGFPCQRLPGSLGSGKGEGKELFGFLIRLADIAGFQRQIGQSLLQRQPPIPVKHQRLATHELPGFVKMLECVLELPKSGFGPAQDDEQVTDVFPVLSPRQHDITGLHHIREVHREHVQQGCDYLEAELARVSLVLLLLRNARLDRAQRFSPSSVEQQTPRI